ncbi:hypothetical protein [uncultured Psychrosphaera sp.]|jgi:hypothetical protein|uniref:hypothetical protein n=1 Tax=uncultured Psychrosphaera sp. TaxID=1403522 RepID=UPI00262D3C77|nr:hypothetical protein [uncultured Psychrosphaera sp.]
MKIENKSFTAAWVSLLLLLAVVVPLLANMEPQMIFGLSNSFWSGFVIGSSILGMIILIAWKSKNVNS